MAAPPAPQNRSRRRGLVIAGPVAWAGRVPVTEGGVKTEPHVNSLPLRPLGDGDELEVGDGDGFCVPVVVGASADDRFGEDAGRQRLAHAATVRWRRRRRRARSETQTWQ